MVRILFIHPDLGIGGAERLVVDAALALKNQNHKVSFLTNHHDETHCFEETTDGDLPVCVVGDWMPRHVFGRFYALCAYLRMIYAAAYASFIYSRRESIDVIICDQISIGIPILRLAKGSPKIIFYCHFPDQLLSAPGGCLKKLYRSPLNFFEEYTVGMADRVLVNSKFTLRVFRETFARLDITPDVVYPSLNTKYFDEMNRRYETGSVDSEDIMVSEDSTRSSFIFLDINRYERKKNHVLALNAFKALAELLPLTDFKRCRLVVAGGYDTRVVENIEHFRELEEIKKKLNLKDNAQLLRSPNDAEKFRLLRESQCLLYTPENEHFGIVPLEGMYMSKPIIAVNSGGPTETIVHKSTGFLCENDSLAFARAMAELYKDKTLRESMGNKGRKRFEQKFSFRTFAEKLHGIVTELSGNQSTTTTTTTTRAGDKKIN